MTTVAPDQPEDDGIDLRILTARVIARWRMVAVIVLAFTIAFTAGAFLMTPIYRSTAILAPAGQQSSGRGLLNSALSDLGGVAELAGLNVGTVSPETEEAIAVLKSRELTEAFIRDWNLTPKLFARRWDARTNTWKAGLFGRTRVPSAAKAFDKFDREIRAVSLDRKTGLITLQVDWKDRAEAAAWANELVRRVNAEMRARAVAQADASMAYLEKESQATQTVTARDAIGRLMQTQIKQRMVANVSPEYAFRVVDKAMEPDTDDPIRPNKPVLVVIGFLVGAIAALAAVSLAGDPTSRSHARIRAT